MGLLKLKVYHRGLKLLVSLFQCIVVKVLQSFKGTVNYLVGIVITDRDSKEHLENLREVLNRLKKRLVLG